MGAVEFACGKPLQVDGSLVVSAAGDECDHDVDGVTIEVLAAYLWGGGCPGIGVPSGQLDLSERYSGVETGDND
jgi:hypothetical protein